MDDALVSECHMILILIVEVPIVHNTVEPVYINTA
jgi:hypothetical protein